MGYSGNTEFDFEIERYENRSTGELLPLDEVESKMKSFGFDDEALELLYEYKVITLSVSGSSYYQEGRSYGLPENCYPDEGDTEITAVIGPDGKDWHSLLTASEVESALEMIQDEVSQGGDYEPDDDYDDYDDYHHNQD